jgi:sugar phosphate isomerase/epimerase
MIVNHERVNPLRNEKGSFKIGIDNYGLHPLGLSPMEILDWAKKNGAEGVQFSGLSQQERELVDEDYLREMSKHAKSLDMYIEWGGGQHIPLDLGSWEEKDIFSVNQRAAKEAAFIGTRIVRSCSGGQMRWIETSPATETLLQAMTSSLLSQKHMLKDHNVILAIETHFEFTTHELIRAFEKCEAEPGEYLGICLDTMNLLTMLEDPLSGAERILPWIVSTHIKDGGILLNADGLITFPSELGKGVVAIKKILEKLGALQQEIHLSIEDHGGEFFLPIFNPHFLAEFPDLTPSEFGLLIELTQQTEAAVQKGLLNITQREEWPDVCEERIKRDLNMLKNLIRSTA